MHAKCIIVFSYYWFLILKYSKAFDSQKYLKANKHNLKKQLTKNTTEIETTSTVSVLK